MPDTSSRLGTKLGPKIAMLVSQAVVHTHSKLIHVKHKLAMAVFHSISDEISVELDETLRPLLRLMLDRLPETHTAYPAIRFLHNEQGQLKALVGTSLQGAGLLSSIAEVMNNELQPIVYDLIASNPHSIPAIGDLASLAAAGIIDTGDAISGMAKQGIGSEWANRLIVLSQSWPQFGDALQMVRRGAIPKERMVAFLEINGVPSDVAGTYLSLIDDPVSPADAALSVLRNTMSQADGERIASQSGLTPESFQILINNTGEPPGTEQLLEGFRRGFIDQATLQKGILESRVRDEWIPLLTKLRFVPMSTADAVNATVQDQMSVSDASAIAEQNGLEPGSINILLAAAGEPLSRTEMEELYNRGLVTQDQVEQALRESRLKNKYTGLAFQLHTKLIAVSELSHAVRYGSLDMADAVASAMKQGYSKSDAIALVQAASDERLEAFKERIVTAGQTLYTDNIISDTQLTQIIQGMGFNSQQATFLVEAAEFHRNAKTVSQVVTSIRTRYVGHKITEQDASGFLDSAGIPSQQRDQLLQEWTIEANADVRVLTEAQIVKAVNNDLITPDDGTSRLEALGYSSGDAQLLIAGA